MVTVIVHKEAEEIFAKLEVLQNRLDRLQEELQQSKQDTTDDEICDFERAREIHCNRRKNMEIYDFQCYYSE